MSNTPKTEDAKFSGIHAHPDEEYVDADFARELERENTHLLVLATNAEFNRSKLERENARLRDSNNVCAEWVKQSANQWMHRPRGGWPIGLRKAYASVHDSALPNV
jgi:hypothetical protein